LALNNCGWREALSEELVAPGFHLFGLEAVEPVAAECGDDPRPDLAAVALKRRGSDLR